ncbi:MAG: GDSL-type esterase/lipase family protein [Leptospiraceae bacterium]|nr:GDSL-type esterase/lipase family protein [Leptospiraceae bacterium]MDW7976336.1 GDSL-type esterase/lipase family protein [Leptospiraceae bacterium]
MKKVKFFIVFIFFIFSYCKTLGEEFDQSEPGKNYFEPGFECKRGFLEKETNVFYLKLRENIRKNFPPVKEKPFLVIAGESTSALFESEIYRSYFPEYNVVNRAIGGETTILFLTSMDEDILALKPDVIFLSIGGNDLLGGRCLNLIINNLNLIFYKISQQSPDTYIIFASIPPVLSWKVNTITPYFNQKIQNLLKQYPKAIYFDLWEILSDEEVPKLREEYYRKNTDFLSTGYDKLHFNQKGYEEIAKKLKPILDQIYKEKYKK